MSANHHLFVPLHLVFSSCWRRYWQQQEENKREKGFSAAAAPSASASSSQQAATLITTVCTICRSPPQPATRCRLICCSCAPVPVFSPAPFSSSALCGSEPSSCPCSSRSLCIQHQQKDDDAASRYCGFSSFSSGAPPFFVLPLLRTTSIRCLPPDDAHCRPAACNCRRQHHNAKRAQWRVRRKMKKRSRSVFACVSLGVCHLLNAISCVTHPAAPAGRPDTSHLTSLDPVRVRAGRCVLAASWRMGTGGGRRRRRRRRTSCGGGVSLCC